MKTLAWLFGIFVCASSAYGQKTVTIEGDIRNMPDTVRLKETGWMYDRKIRKKW